MRGYDNEFRDVSSSHEDGFTSFEALDRSHVQLPLSAADGTVARFCGNNVQQSTITEEDVPNHPKNGERDGRVVSVTELGSRGSGFEYRCR